MACGPVLGGHVAEIRIESLPAQGSIDSVYAAAERHEKVRRTPR
jgi:hypothetical protein